MKLSDVLYVCYHFPPLSQTFVYEELQALRRQGFGVRVLAIRRPPGQVSREAADLADECTYVGDLSPRDMVSDLSWWMRRDRKRLLATLRIAASPCPSFPEHTRLLYHLALALHVGRTYDFSDVGIMHVHFAGAAADIALGLYRLLELPFSVVVHAAEVYLGANAMAGKIAAATPFITISHYNKRQLVQRFGPAAERVRVVHCGVRAASYPRGKVPSTGRASIVAIGRLSEKKGHDTLIRACALLRSRGRELQCSIIGGGELEAQLQGLIDDLRLQKTVRLLGPRDHSEALDLLRSASASALACRVARNGDRDGVPVSLMESMALGVPTVSTVVSGIPELIVDGETGLLVPPDEPGALAHALERLFDETGLAERLAAGGRRKIEEAFDVDRNAMAVGCLLLAAVPALADSDG